MQSGWFARLFFAVVAVLAVAAVVSGTACTRWGQPGPVTPTLAPLSALFVNPNTGSDTSGNGSQSKPYKTLTKAVAVLAAASQLSPSGVSITLYAGVYDAAGGEKFPIVIPTGVSISGPNFGSSPKNGAFIDGIGEDTLFEQVLHAPPHTAYSTLEVAAPGMVSLGDIYVGASKISLPSSKAFYASLDVFSAVAATTAEFGAGIVSSLRNVNGAIVPGGSFTCHSCLIHGNDFGVGAFAVPVATASPYATGPSVTLDDNAGRDADITAKVVDVLTDGTVNVTTAGEHFLQANYAFADALTPVVPVTVRGAVDFGGGAAASTGGNVFIGARTTEIFIIRRNETVSALDDTWNPNQQHANRGGQYVRKLVFAAGATGKNVTVRHDAVGSTVSVGPAPIPTPTPTTTPSGAPTSTPT
jgi:hypothetical protein